MCIMCKKITTPTVEIKGGERVVKVGGGGGGGGGGLRCLMTTVMLWATAHLGESGGMLPQKILSERVSEEF